MIINNYQVSMNVNHFNLAFEQTDAQVSSNTNSSSSDKSNQLSDIVEEENSFDDGYNELSKELSKAILKNLNNETRTIRGDRVEITNTFVEAEALSFVGKAIVQTKDREIEVSLDVSLSRSFVQTNKINISLEEANKPIQMIDPLIISLDGGMPSLSSKTFSFDIDSDGKKDQISELGRNSAFLVLDKNNNGKVDDGNELFGTKSGDGFSDLRKYDDDNNGWIDENDAVFDKLRVWQKDGQKSDLIAIGEVGIGAIYLGGVQTQFSLKSDTNNTLGEIKKSSMFLFEDGRAGVISHIDFAVNSQTTEKLSDLGSVMKNLSALKLRDTYNSSSNKNSSSDSDTQLEKLQMKLRSLQNSLTTANASKQKMIEAQISAITTQIMMMLDAQ